MKIINCLQCGNPAEIRTREQGPNSYVWVQCTHCGTRSKIFTGKQDTAAGRIWAVIAWNCGYYDREGEA